MFYSKSRLSGKLASVGESDTDDDEDDLNSNFNDKNSNRFLTHSQPPHPVHNNEQSKPNESSFFNVKKQAPKNEENIEDEDSDEEIQSESDLTLSVLYQGSKLGCSFYDKVKKTLFYLNDLPETSVSNFELTNLIINDLNPNKVITSAKTDLKFITFLKKKCNITDDSQSDEEQDLDEDDLISNNSSDEDLPKKIPKTRFFVTTANDYNYELSKELILQINTIENMPEFINVSLPY